MNNITCPSCGGQKATPINDHDYRCDYCGHTFSPVTPRPIQQSNSSSPSQFINNLFSDKPTNQSPFDSRTASGKNRMTAGLLALLLGGLGIHHFYLGNTTKGILYALLCWTYIPAIVGFIEGIIYLTQSDQEFASKH